MLLQISCRSRRVAEVEPLDDGAVVPELSSGGEAEPDRSEAEKPRRKLLRKREKAEPELAREEAGPEKLPDKNESLESQAKKMFKEAKVHYELGDYDFAAEALRKIGKGSPYYAQAQLLLMQLR